MLRDAARSKCRLQHVSAYAERAEISKLVQCIVLRSEEVALHIFIYLYNIQINQCRMATLQFLYRSKKDKGSLTIRFRHSSNIHYRYATKIVSNKEYWFNTKGKHKNF